MSAPRRALPGTGLATKNGLPPRLTCLVRSRDGEELPECVPDSQCALQDAAAARGVVWRRVLAQRLRSAEAEGEEAPPFMPFATAHFSSGRGSFVALSAGDVTNDDCLLYDSQARSPALPF